MTVTLANISADIGELYSSVTGGTTSVSSIISRASALVVSAGGASTDDTVIRPLADAMVVNQMIGNIDPVNKTIGSLSVGNKDLKGMRDYFKNEANKAAVINGYSLDGLRILLEDSA